MEGNDSMTPGGGEQWDTPTLLGIYISTVCSYSSSRNTHHYWHNCPLGQWCLPNSAGPDLTDTTATQGDNWQLAIMMAVVGASSLTTSFSVMTGMMMFLCVNNNPRGASCPAPGHGSLALYQHMTVLPCIWTWQQRPYIHNVRSLMAVLPCTYTWQPCLVPWYDQSCPEPGHGILVKQSRMLHLPYIQPDKARDSAS